ncbi:MAG TPA: hypothetical protein VJL58_12060, partial [Pyrinomonadaceae bacterium]|nr:hypothetical protein [Pyrinomonadaceae bacterium]
RAEMDLQLMLAAKRCGVEVTEDARVIAANIQDDKAKTIILRLDDGSKREIAADIFVDATGRAAALSRLTDNIPVSRKRSGIVGFKAHLQNVVPEEGVCEIYFFDGGYGGLGHVEDGKANFCFLVKAGVAKQFAGQTDSLFEWILNQNRRAGERLRAAAPTHDWLAVAIDEFGRKRASTLSNLIAVGDAGAFIDPFTGSGILMALESSELLAASVSVNGFEKTAYLAAHKRLFRRRLAVAAVLRRAAFMPKAASAAIRLASASDRLRQTLARATRARRTVF